MVQSPTVSLTFIGGGVLATSIISGIMDDKKRSQSNGVRYDIGITTRREEHAHVLRQKFPQTFVTTDNRASDLWKPQWNGDCKPVARIALICTQPQYTSTVCEDLRHVMAVWTLEPRPVIVTVCPGITVRQLESWLTPDVSIIRTMPNTPVAVRQGATALFASPKASQNDVTCVTALFRPISPAVCVLPAEELLDVTASISGSAPAYYFAFSEMLIEAGVSRGMPRELASELVKQSITGSALLASHSDTSFPSLLNNVCVPGGSTEKAIKCFNDRGLSGIVDAAVERSLLANRAMGSEIGNR